MKPNSYVSLLMLMACILLAVACGPIGKSVSELPPDLKIIGGGQPEVGREDSKLIIWSDIALGDEMISEFEKANPGVKVEVQEKLLDTELKDYMQAMVDQEPVDIFVIDSTFLGKFSNLQGFENLSAAPYLAGGYEESVPKGVWNNHLSVSDDTLFTLPVALSPAVLYYRADLMEKYGYPSDPEELAIYMESEENLFLLAEEMKSHGHSIFLWDSSIIDLYISKYGFLTDNFDNNISKEDFIKSIELTKEIMKQRYMVNKDIWMPDGEQAIRDGEIIMLTLGSWGEKYLPEIAPDLSGAWKATRMPLGIDGWSSSTSLAISSHSNKKELAWKFLEFTMERGLDFKEWPLVPAYQPARTEAWRRNQINPYFGNQKTYALYEDLMKKTDAYNATPFDDELFSVLYDVFFQGMDQKLDSEEIYKNYINTVNKKYGEEIDVLRNR